MFGPVTSLYLFVPALYGLIFLHEPLSVGDPANLCDPLPHLLMLVVVSTRRSSSLG